MKSRKKNKYLILLIVLLAIGIGFAALSTTLKLNGTANVSANTWSVYWDEDSIVVNPNSKSLISPTVSDDIEDENVILNWTVDLDLPGDFYEFSIDAVNAGTLDAMITNITEGIPSDLPNYISYSVTYDDGDTPAQYHKLFKAKGNIPTRQKYKVRIEYLNTITLDQLNEIGSNGLSYEFTYEVQYSQADDRAIVRSVSFTTDPWSKIIAAYNSDDPNGDLDTAMKNGTTREIGLDMDYNGTYETIAHVRIANLSTPDVCQDEDFSQTACGFVLEFVETIESRRFNPGVSGSTYGTGNNGSWVYSEANAYVNSKIYREGETAEQDFTTNGIWNALPADLKGVIIDTKVVSGGGSNDKNTNPVFIETDKLYLLDATEIWGTTFTNQYNLAKGYERQLDYYNYTGVTTTTSTLGPVIKQDLNGTNSTWWLRSAGSGNNSSMWRVTDAGANSTQGCTNSNGISPAFRIAKID